MKCSFFRVRVAEAQLEPRGFQKHAYLGPCPVFVDRTRPQRLTVEATHIEERPSHPLAKRSFAGVRSQTGVWERGSRFTRFARNPLRPQNPGEIR